MKKVGREEERFGDGCNVYFFCNISEVSAFQRFPSLSVRAGPDRALPNVEPPKLIERHMADKLGKTKPLVCKAGPQ